MVSKEKYTEEKFKSDYIQNIKSISESAHATVLNEVYDSQKLCFETSFTSECYDYRTRKNLQKRTVDIEVWLTILTDISSRLEEEIDSLENERLNLHKVINNLERKLMNGRCRSICGYQLEKNEDIENEIANEIKQLEDERNRLCLKDDDIETLICKLKCVKRRMDTDIMDKTNSQNIDEQQMHVNRHQVTRGTFRTKKKKTYVPPDKWQDRCETLRSLGEETIREAIDMREELISMFNRISIAVQAQERTVNMLLRRYLHYIKVELDELEWQKSEIESDLQHLIKEEERIERAIVEAMDEVVVAERKQTNRTFKAKPELCSDTAHKCINSVICELRAAIKDMMENRKRKRKLKSSLEKLLININQKICDKYETIEAYANRLETRLPAQKQEACTDALFIEDEKPSTSCKRVAFKSSKRSIKNVTMNSLDCIPETDEAK